MENNSDELIENIYTSYGPAIGKICANTNALLHNTNCTTFSNEFKNLIEVNIPQVNNSLQTVVLTYMSMFIVELISLIIVYFTINRETRIKIDITPKAVLVNYKSVKQSVPSAPSFSFEDTTSNYQSGQFQYTQPQITYDTVGQNYTLPAYANTNRY